MRSCLILALVVITFTAMNVTQAQDIEHNCLYGVDSVGIATVMINVTTGKVTKRPIIESDITFHEPEIIRGTRKADDAWVILDGDPALRVRARTLVYKDKNTGQEYIHSLPADTGFMGISADGKYISLNKNISENTSTYVIYSLPEMILLPTMELSRLAADRPQWSPKGHVAVTTDSSSTIYIINPDRDSIYTTAIPTYESQLSTLWSPDGNYVAWFGWDDSNSVGLLNLATNEVTLISRDHDFPSQLITYTYLFWTGDSTRFIYIGTQPNQEAYLGAYIIATQQSITLASGFTEVLAITEDWKHALLNYSSGKQADKITLLDLVTGKEMPFQPTLQLASTHGRLLMSPDMKKVVIYNLSDSNGPSLTIQDFDRQLSRTYQMSGFMEWAPDSMKLYVLPSSDTRPSALAIYSSDGQLLRYIDAGYISGPIWSICEDV